jgi:hypothetical protein
VRPAAGPVSTVAFKKDPDGGLSFTKELWRDFHLGEEGLQAGQALVMTINTTRRPDLHFIFVFIVN